MGMIFRLLKKAVFSRWGAIGSTTLETFLKRGFMRKILLSCVLLFQSLGAAEGKELYLQYLKQYEVLKPLGNVSQGEIEIITDPKKMEELEKTMGRKVGIVAQDKYWIWINDAVHFPSGKDGIYGRILNQGALKGLCPAAVMPVLPDGRIVLVRQHRHCTRSWEYELPRGGANPNESTEEVAIREAKEETGMKIGELSLLGHMALDSGMTNTVVPIYLAKVVAKEEAAPEESEAIAGIEAFSVEELKQGYVKGYLIEKKSGAKIPLRDPFLAFALFQAELRKVLIP